MKPRTSPQKFESSSSREFELKLQNFNALICSPDHACRDEAIHLRQPVVWSRKKVPRNADCDGHASADQNGNPVGAAAVGEVDSEDGGCDDEPPNVAHEMPVKLWLVLLDAEDDPRRGAADLHQIWKARVLGDRAAFADVKDDRQPRQEEPYRQESTSRGPLGTRRPFPALFRRKRVRLSFPRTYSSIIS